MRPMLIGAPAIEPISLAEAKSWLREDGVEEDQLIQALIVSARLTLEAYTRRFFVTQSWRLVLDAWPRDICNAQALAIPFSPFQSVLSIRIYDANDNARILPAASYRAGATNDGGRVVFSAAPPAPGRGVEGVEVDFVAGYGSLASDTPEPLRRAMLILVAHWREKRGDESEDSLPRTVVQLAGPYRRERII